MAGSNVRFQNFVVDEADTLIDADHYEQFQAIQNSLHENARCLLFSPCQAERLNLKTLKSTLQDPIEIETDFANRIPLHIKQTFRRVKV